MRVKCIQKMGDELFKEIYMLMKEAHRGKLEERQLQEELKSRYSKKELELSMDVAQLLYLEETER
jgi:hypothetical protein